MRWFQLILATVLAVAIMFIHQQVEAGKKKRELLLYLLLSKFPKKKIILPLPLPLPLPIPIIEKTRRLVRQEPVLIKKVIKVPYEVPVKEPYPVPVPYKEPVYIPVKTPYKDSYKDSYDPPSYDSYSAASGHSSKGYYGPGKYDDKSDAYADAYDAAATNDGSDEYEGENDDNEEDPSY